MPHPAEVFLPFHLLPHGCSVSDDDEALQPVGPARWSSRAYSFLACSGSEAAESSASASWQALAGMCHW